MSLRLEHQITHLPIHETEINWTILLLFGISCVQEANTSTLKKTDVLTLVAQTCHVLAVKRLPSQELPEVSRLREYIRINASHPSPNYGPSVEWLRKQAAEIGIAFNYERYSLYDDNSFAVWLTWKGVQPRLKSILLGSHMDTVAVDPSKWIYPPFSAHKDVEGRIFGRGATDMKSTTVATLEAVRSLKKSGFIPQRTVHIAIFPDEELYNRGVKSFVNSESFDRLNVGFALDEGPGGSRDKFYVSYAQKTRWLVKFLVHSGMTIHSSAMPETTTGEKLTIVLNRMMDFRAAQFNLSSKDSSSVNLVQIGGGLGTNIIPDDLWAIFDMRLSSGALKEVDSFLSSVAAEAGKDTMIQFLIKDSEFPSSVVDDSSIWWRAAENICQQLKKICTRISISAVTDGRFLRGKGIPVFGMGGLGGSGIHSSNEYIKETDFIEGIENFKLFIKTFSTVVSDD